MHSFQLQCNVLSDMHDIDFDSLKNNHRFFKWENVQITLNYRTIIIELTSIFAFVSDRSTKETFATGACHCAVMLIRPFVTANATTFSHFLIVKLTNINLIIYLFIYCSNKWAKYVSQVNQQFKIKRYRFYDNNIILLKWKCVFNKRVISHRRHRK